MKVVRREGWPRTDIRYMMTLKAEAVRLQFGGPYSKFPLRSKNWLEWGVEGFNYYYSKINFIRGWWWFECDGFPCYRNKYEL